MCNEYKEKPLGLTEAESVWYNHNRVVQEAMNNDPYTNGGVLDSTNKYGYVNNQPFGVGPGKMIIEKYFSYEELKFMSCFRLQTATLPDVKRFKELISRFEKYLSEKSWETTMSNAVPGCTPSYPYMGVSVQPLYGAPVPTEIPKEWDDHFASLSNDAVQKGPNEPDEQSSDEKMTSFLGSAWNDPPVRTRTGKLYGVTGFPFPEKIGKKKDQYKKRVVLSAKEIPSKADIQNGPNEPDDEDPLEETRKLFGTLAAPSSGIAINENPVPLTEENKSVDKEEKNND